MHYLLCRIDISPAGPLITCIIRLSKLVYGSSMASGFFTGGIKLSVLASFGSGGHLQVRQSLTSNNE